MNKKRVQVKNLTQMTILKSKILQVLHTNKKLKEIGKKVQLYFNKIHQNKLIK